MLIILVKPGPQAALRCSMHVSRLQRNPGLVTKGTS